MANRVEGRNILDEGFGGANLRDMNTGRFSGGEKAKGLVEAVKTAASGRNLNLGNIQKSEITQATSTISENLGKNTIEVQDILNQQGDGLKGQLKTLIEQLAKAQTKTGKQSVSSIQDIIKQVEQIKEQSPDLSNKLGLDSVTGNLTTAAVSSNKRKADNSLKAALGFGDTGFLGFGAKSKEEVLLRNLQEEQPLPDVAKALTDSTNQIIQEKEATKETNQETKEVIKETAQETAKEIAAVSKESSTPTAGGQFKSGIDREGPNEVDLLEEIRDILKKIAEDGVFAGGMGGGMGLDLGLRGGRGFRGGSRGGRGGRSGIRGGGSRPTANTTPRNTVPRTDPSQRTPQEQTARDQRAREVREERTRQRQGSRSTTSTSTTRPTTASTSTSTPRTTAPSTSAPGRGPAPSVSRGGGMFSRAGKFLGGAGRALGGAARFAGPIGAAITAGTAVYGGFQGAMADPNAGLFERAGNAGSSMLNTLSFGLVGRSADEIREEAEYNRLVELEQQSQMSPEDVEEYNNRLEEINNANQPAGRKAAQRRQLDAEFTEKFGGTPESLQVTQAYTNPQSLANSQVVPTGQALNNTLPDQTQNSPTVINNVTNNNTTGGAGQQQINVAPDTVRNSESVIQRRNDLSFGY